MQLLVGLGNPGTKYARNRHNIGFMLMDAVAEKYRAGAWKQKFRGELSECNVDGRKILLFKPLTFMNLSGEAVGELIRFYKIPVEEVCVFHDELDLPTGKIRVKQGGGAGGHNGLKSLDQHVGENYWRVRIGIGHPGDKDLVSPYVLSDFSIAELDEQEAQARVMVEMLPELIAGKEAKFMSEVARLTNKENT